MSRWYACSLWLGLVYASSGGRKTDKAAQKCEGPNCSLPR